MSRLLLAVIAVFLLPAASWAAAISSSLTGKFSGDYVVSYSLAGTPLQAYQRPTSSADFNSGWFSFDNTTDFVQGKWSFSQSASSAAGSNQAIFNVGSGGTSLSISGTITLDLGANSADITFPAGATNLIDGGAGSYFKEVGGANLPLGTLFTINRSGLVTFEYLLVGKSSSVTPAQSFPPTVPPYNFGSDPYGFLNWNYNIANVVPIPPGAVPEPGSLAVFGSMCVAGFFFKKRRKLAK